MGRKDSKYSWVAKGFEEWIRKETSRVEKEMGVKIGTSEATRLLKDRVLIPNQVSLVAIFQPVKLNGKRKKKK